MTPFLLLSALFTTPIQPTTPLHGKKKREHYLFTRIVLFSSPSPLPTPWLHLPPRAPLRSSPTLVPRNSRGNMQGGSRPARRRRIKRFPPPLISAPRWLARQCPTPLFSSPRCSSNPPLLSAPRPISPLLPFNLRISVVMSSLYRPNGMVHGLNATQSVQEPSPLRPFLPFFPDFDRLNGSTV